MPSWKCLYEMNKNVIGDNPDLLKAGTVLKVPVIEGSSGCRLLKEKGVNPEDYLGGLRYKYPFVPFSLTRSRDDGNPENDFEEEREFRIWNTKTGKALATQMVKKADEVYVLIPDVKDFEFGIKGYPIHWNGKMHYHPDDLAAGLDKADKSKETDY
jgi:hypothetical protein